MGESVDDFLEKVTVERKPLSEGEKEEAMMVAFRIEKKAREIAGGKSYVSLLLTSQSPDPFLRKVFGIRLPEEDGKMGRFASSALRTPMKAETYLIVHVGSLAKDAEGGLISLPDEEYHFTSSEVTKIIIGSKSSVEEILNQNRESPYSSYIDLNKVRNQWIEESYHPDKVDLNSLLNNLSAAKPLRS